ncbi:kinase-like domain-containing protein [Mycena epipterygia]|nr:kinase-like domain-containing protein [Mycena epipterygia]
MLVNLTVCWQTLYREALCWGPLDHPNILSFLGVNEQIEPYRSFCLISPWMDNGNLMSFLEKNPDFDRLKAVIDTAEGMRYLHELDPPIIHADIRGANILVTKELRCCLANFGLAAATEMVITSVRNDDTLPWMAPEILQEIPPGTTTSSTRDIFAFGCTMLEIFTGKRPFDGVPMPAVFLKVMNGERPSRPGAGSSAQEISDETWAVISSCWRQEAAERPSARQALRDLGVPLSLNYTILRRPGKHLGSHHHLVHITC